MHGRGAEGRKMLGRGVGPPALFHAKCFGDGALHASTFRRLFRGQRPRGTRWLKGEPFGMRRSRGPACRKINVCPSALRAADDAAGVEIPDHTFTVEGCAPERSDPCRAPETIARERLGEVVDLVAGHEPHPSLCVHHCARRTGGIVMQFGHAVDPPDDLHIVGVRDELAQRLGGDGPHGLERVRGHSNRGWRIEGLRLHLCISGSRGELAQVTPREESCRVAVAESDSKGIVANEFCVERAQRSTRSRAWQHRQRVCRKRFAEGPCLRRR